jgi:serine/threonine protein kinase
MPESGPNPQQTLAVLLGASSFERAPKLAQGPAFYMSAQDFRKYLTSSTGLGLPRDNVNWRFDDNRSSSDQLRDIGDFLETRSADLKNKGIPPQDLIVYYVGHGLFWGPDHAYCLAVRATDEGSEGLSSIRVSDLASVIKAHARFLRKFLILDCCFSAAAYREFQSGPLQAGRVRLLDELPERGTALLCSASAQDPSLAPEGLPRTMFSDALLRVLRQGHSSLGPRLSVSELGDLIKVNLLEAYPDTWVRPEVHSPDQREGDIAGVCLFPNAAHQAQPAADERWEAEERRLESEAERWGRKEAAEREEAKRLAVEAERKARAQPEAERANVERGTKTAESGPLVREQSEKEWTQSLCMGCMANKGVALRCPDCGWEEGQPADSPQHLPPRTVLEGKYLVGRALGQGGFGITYLAWDLNLNCKAAVKEYFPRDLCTRGRDGCTVQPLTQRTKESFGYGLGKFLEEGQALARFRDHPGMVSVLGYFKENGTAYLVMAYLAGVTFKQYLEKHKGKIPFPEALSILTPVMDALHEVHNVGMLHRDISPDNIYVSKNGQVKLLDFGAARYAMGEVSQDLSLVLKPGYAPEEQFRRQGRQGPWTDVYALAATFYRAITGSVPSDAPDRLAHDDLIPPRHLRVNIQLASEDALLKALAVRAEDRFQTVIEFRRAVSVEPLPRRDWERKLREGLRRNRKAVALVAAVAVTALVVTATVLHRVYRPPFHPPGSPTQGSTAGPAGSGQTASGASAGGQPPKSAAVGEASPPIPSTLSQTSKPQKKVMGGNLGAGATSGSAGVQSAGPSPVQAPPPIQSFIELGQQYHCDGDYDRAIREYQEGLAYHPKNKELLDLLTKAQKAKAQEEHVLQ